MNIPFFGAAALRDMPGGAPCAQDHTVGVTAPTRLYTHDGPVPAQHLVPGDRVITRGNGVVALRDVRFRDTSDPMVRIGPATLGRARPESFVLLPPEQQIVLRRATGAALDGIFSAEALIDGDTIRWHPLDAPLRIVDLDFGAPQIVHAGGLELAAGH